VKFKHLATIFSIIGIGFLVGGLIDYQKTVEFLENAIVVSGEVTEIQKIRRADGPVYKPVIRYTDHTGKQREFVANYATNPPAYFEGEILEVLYDPNDPEYPLHVRVNDGFGRWLRPVGLSVFGGFFLLVVGFASYLYRKGGEVKFGKQPESPQDGYDF